MDATVICTAITAIATIAVAIISKNNHNTDKHVKADLERMSTSLRNVHNHLGAIEAKLNDNDLQTCRIDFRQMVLHCPDNIPAVLEVATRYFLDLGGNADMGALFLWWVQKYNVEQWANEHRRDIGPLLACARHLKS